MKKNLFITLLILIHILSFAQIQWQEGGVPVRQGENIEWNQQSVASDDGTFVSIWTDTRDGTRGVYAQKVDENGNKLWGETGLEIYNSDRMQSMPIAVQSDDNSIIISWMEHDDISFESAQIRVQKINSSGNKLWGTDGVLIDNNLLCFSLSYYSPYKMVKHSDGGVYIIWREGYYPDYAILGTRLLNDGSVAGGWEEGVDLLQDIFLFEVHSDNFDGVILSYAINDDIYIQRIDETGNKLWGYYGTLLFNGDDEVYELDVCSANSDEYLFSWRTVSQINPVKIQMQKTDTTGFPIWDSPITICEENSIRNMLTVCPPDSQPIITWIKNETIYSQKIDVDGSLLWGEDGITIFESNNYILNNSVIQKADCNGGFLISFIEYFYNDNDIAIFQKINENGELLFNEDGLIISELSYPYNFPSLAINSQKYHLCWLNNCGNYSALIYQIIDENGNILLEENGEELFPGLTGEIYDIQIIPNEDNPIIFWTDKRNKFYQRIYFQILNDDGTSVLSENGIPLTSETGFDQDYFNTVFGENSQTIVAVWSEDNINGFRQIFAQGLDTSGNLVWADSTGIYLTSADHMSNKPKISIMDNSGIDEYFIGWEDYTDFFDGRIQGQKIIDGNLEWGTEGKTIVDRDSDDILSDVVEDFYIWKSVGYNNQNIFCIRVDENGDPVAGWDDDGLEVCIEDGVQRNARGVKVPQGLLIVWEDFRNEDLHFYGQIVTPEGNILWQEGGLPLIEEDGIENFSIHYNDAIYLVWNGLDDEFYYNYYMQKFNENGDALWQDDGVRISYWTYLTNYEPAVTSFGQDILVVWEHCYLDGSIKILVQQISPFGELQYDLEGITICDQIMVQYDPQIYVNGSSAYITWQDGRSVILGDEGFYSIPGIYAQKLLLEPTSTENELEKPVTWLHNYPNPFNPETTISFSLTTESTENTEINIFNIKGQKIKKLPVNLSGVEGEGKIYSVIWNGTDQNNQPVSSGVYFYQLNVDDKVVDSKKCLLLK